MIVLLIPITNVDQWDSSEKFESPETGFKFFSHPGQNSFFMALRLWKNTNRYLSSKSIFKYS